MIYDYVFYHSYKLRQGSGGPFDPIGDGSLGVLPGLILNIGSIICFFEGLANQKVVPSFGKPVSYIIGIIFIIGAELYYRKNKRYLKIIDKYDKKYNGKVKKWYHLLVVLSYYIPSGILFLLCAMYRNHDGPFAG